MAAVDSDGPRTAITSGGVMYELVFAKRVNCSLAINRVMERWPAVWSQNLDSCFSPNGCCLFAHCTSVVGCDWLRDSKRATFKFRPVHWVLVQLSRTSDHRAAKMVQLLTPHRSQTHQSMNIRASLSLLIPKPAFLKSTVYAGKCVYRVPQNLENTLSR